MPKPRRIDVSIFHGHGDIEECTTGQWCDVFAWLSFYAATIERVYVGHKTNGGVYVHIIRTEV